jgi:hypothetical protein
MNAGHIYTRPRDYAARPARIKNGNGSGTSFVVGRRGRQGPLNQPTHAVLPNEGRHYPKREDRRTGSLLRRRSPGLDRSAEARPGRRPRPRRCKVNLRTARTTPAQRRTARARRKNPGEFFRAEIVEHPGEQIPADEMFAEYCAWCSDNQLAPIDCRSLGKQIVRRYRGIVEKRRLGSRDRRRWTYQGIRWRVERSQ